MSRKAFWLRFVDRRLVDAPDTCTCIAHHLTVAGDGSRTLMIASIRYLDEFVKVDDDWLFAERGLMVDWTETRPSTP